MPANMPLTCVNALSRSNDSGSHALLAHGVVSTKSSDRRRLTPCRCWAGCNTPPGVSASEPGQPDSPPLMGVSGGICAGQRSNRTVGHMGHCLPCEALPTAWHSWQRARGDSERSRSAGGQSPRGTYLVISEKLRQRIDADESGEALPSEADLMREYDVSRNTIRRALKVLEAEGLVQSAPPGPAGGSCGGSDHRSLAERMNDLITEQSLSVGDPPYPPSEAQLCERFGASRTAVRRVLAQMEGNGLLDTVHGKGRTVRALPSRAVRP